MNEIHVLVCKVGRKTMALHRGQNQYSDFVALETLLRFENCSSSHCLLSSWRRFHVFESSHPSFYRTGFFGAPLAFLRGVAMGLCRRCVISVFVSSGLSFVHSPTYLGRLGLNRVKSVFLMYFSSAFKGVLTCLKGY